MRDRQLAEHWCACVEVTLRVAMDIDASLGTELLSWPSSKVRALSVTTSNACRRCFTVQSQAK